MLIDQRCSWRIVSRKANNWIPTLSSGDLRCGYARFLALLRDSKLPIEYSVYIGIELQVGQRLFAQAKHRTCTRFDLFQIGGCAAEERK